MHIETGDCTAQLRQQLAHEKDYFKRFVQFVRSQVGTLRGAKSGDFSRLARLSLCAQPVVLPLQVVLPFS